MQGTLEKVCGQNKAVFSLSPAPLRQAGGHAQCQGLPCLLTSVLCEKMPSWGTLWAAGRSAHPGNRQPAWTCSLTLNTVCVPLGSVLVYVSISDC